MLIRHLSKGEPLAFLPESIRFDLGDGDGVHDDLEVVCQLMT
jgi:hypothetical protein